AATYCEISPSGEGLRVIGLGNGPYLDRRFQLPGSGVSVEVYRDSKRYFTVTGKKLEGASFPGGLGNIDQLADDLVRELAPEVKSGGVVIPLEKAGAKIVPWNELPHDLRNLISKPPSDDLSRDFHHAVNWLADYGHSAGQIERLVAGQPIVPERYAK